MGIVRACLFCSSLSSLFACVSLSWCACEAGGEKREEVHGHSLVVVGLGLLLLAAVAMEQMSFSCSRVHRETIMKLAFGAASAAGGRKEILAVIYDCLVR